MLLITAQEIKSTFNIAIVVSRFNEAITEALYEGALQRLKDLQFGDEHITVVWVPGAVEIPLVTKRLAGTNQYKAIIVLGAVIRGETSHYDYVCQQVSHGCQQVALENDIPVIFGILTTEDEEQALARAGGIHGNKGVDAINAALEMISVIEQIG